jgi:hypothetical protein
MEGRPGSAEASERIEGLVDEMQRWVQSGELRMMNRTGRVEEAT